MTGALAWLLADPAAHSMALTYLRHCEHAHPDPDQLRLDPMGSSRPSHDDEAGGACRECARLHPCGPVITLFHHTSRAAARAITEEQRMVSHHRTGMVFFVDQPFWTDGGVTGICPKRTGAVIQASIPSALARFTQFEPQHDLFGVVRERPAVYRVHPTDLAQLRTSGWDHLHQAQEPQP